MLDKSLLRGSLFHKCPQFGFDPIPESVHGVSGHLNIFILLQIGQGQLKLGIQINDRSIDPGAGFFRNSLVSHLLESHLQFRPGLAE